MKILDIHPKYLNCRLVKLICSNKELKKRYIQKYKTFFNIKKYNLIHYGGDTFQTPTKENCDWRDFIKFDTSLSLYTVNSSK